MAVVTLLAVTALAAPSSATTTASQLVDATSPDWALVGNPVCVAVKALDGSGAPVAGVDVRFEARESTQRHVATVATDANGRAQACETFAAPTSLGYDAYVDVDASGDRGFGEPFVIRGLQWIWAGEVVPTPADQTLTVGNEACVTFKASALPPHSEPKIPIAGATLRFSWPPPGWGSPNNTFSGTGTTDANGEAAFCYTGRFAGFDFLYAYADRDGDSVQDADEPSGQSRLKWLGAGSAAADPALQTVTIGNEACVTFTATGPMPILGGGWGTTIPIPDLRVGFGWPRAGWGSPNNTFSGVATTDADGRAAFCYTGLLGGIDFVHVWADLDDDGVQDEDEQAIGHARIDWLGAGRAWADPQLQTKTIGNEACVTFTATGQMPILGGGWGTTIPVPDLRVGFGWPRSGLGSPNNTFSGAATTDADGKATFCYTGRVPGIDFAHVWADLDDDGVQDEDEQAIGDARIDWLGPGSIRVEPWDLYATLGSELCLTFTATGPVPLLGRGWGPTVPIPELRLGFGWPPVGWGPPNNVFSGAATTDQDGQATFCYTGAKTGFDYPQVHPDLDGDGVRDAEEEYVIGGARVEWLVPLYVNVDAEPDWGLEPGDEVCLTASVAGRRASGDFVPLEDAAVIFRSDPTQAQTNVVAPTTRATDLSGEAELCYTGSPKPGYDYVEVIADTDRDGHKDTDEPSSFVQVTWFDLVPPVIDAADVTAEATGPAGASVSYTVTATDDSAVYGVTCLPASGAVFPLGASTVDCYAYDTWGNYGFKSFKVNVVDTTPPALTLPATITVAATSPLGAVVALPATASDLVDGARPVVCTPPSGSTFPIGSTPASCTSSDTRSNTVTRATVVTVLGATDQAIGLCAFVQGLGPGSSLAAKACNVRAAIEAGRTRQACGLLGALGAEVRAQTEKSLTPAQAAAISGRTAPLRLLLGC